MFKRPKQQLPAVQPPVAPPVAPEPSYIARDTTFEGNILTSGEIHIDGAVRGMVQAQTCLVDAYGEVQGGIVAQMLYVRGRVTGPISAVHVTIQAGAHVEGNVAHDTISIENGAFVLGNISHRTSHSPAPAIPETYRRETQTEDENFTLDAPVLSTSNGQRNER